jgi:hypothetical protein
MATQNRRSGPMIQEVSTRKNEHDRVQEGLKRMIHFDDGDNDASVNQNVEGKEVTPPSPTSTLYMYLQAEVLGKSTAMSQMSGQLQKLQTEIQERQNAVNEVKSKMLSLQGALGILQSTSAKMRELELVPSAN